MADEHKIEVMDSVIDKAREDVRSFLERILSEEISSAINSRRHERTKNRKDYLNGYWTRKIKTKNLGVIKDIKIPRSRHAGQKLKTVKLYKEKSSWLNLEIVRGYVFGPEFSKINEVASTIFNKIISQEKIKKLTKPIIDSICEYRARRISGDYAYLVLDALWFMTVDKTIGEMKPVYLAMGIRKDMTREIIGTQMALNETVDSWQHFLEGLLKRGLRGSKFELIIYGSLYRLKYVLEEVFPRALKQRCLNSKMSSVLDERNLRNASHQSDIQSELSNIFSRTRKEEVRTELNNFISKWKYDEPRTIKFIKEDLKYILNYFNVPEEKRPLIRTTDLANSVFDEIRVNTNVVACYRNNGVKKDDFFA